MRIPIRVKASLATAALLGLAGCAHSQAGAPSASADLAAPGESHLRHLRQLTFGGSNAEAYWSFDSQGKGNPQGKGRADALVFQHQGKGITGGNPLCDQIYLLRLGSGGENGASEVQPISDGTGRTTCAFFTPDDQRILYSSTRSESAGCPEAPDRSHGYVWPVYPYYKIYSAKADGTDLIEAEPGAPRAYNAETTVCHDGSVVFTSDRDGDLELYTAKLDRLGTFAGVKRITTMPGYDSGAFFSPDCRQIVWRASRPRAGKELEQYRALLKRHLVKPDELEIWVADADGKHARQLTHLGAASFAPSFTPDGKRVIFSSNWRKPGSSEFDLFLVNLNGTGLEQVTYSGGFNAFAMFSADGKKLAFSSNRNGRAPHETNLFVADWTEAAGARVETAGARAETPQDRFQEIVNRLADPALEGRGLGSPGLARAEEIVSQEFSRLGMGRFHGASQQAVEIKTSTGTLATSNNLLGTLGKGCGRVAPVVIGAHLDHLGRTREGIHPGADDNASGVAAILQIARQLKDHGQAERRDACFLFAAFTGEESGVVGSSRMAELLKKTGVHPKAMLNFDMVGRMENNRLLIFGTESAREWPKLVSQACAQERLDCPGGGDGYGPSDMMPFFIDRVPVLYFFTGAHADYHRPSDTADKINATGGVDTANVGYRLAIAAALPSQALHFQKRAPGHPPSSLPAASNASAHALGDKPTQASLGTIPDYGKLSASHGSGVPLAGARAGSPADLADIKEGDLLLAISDSSGKRHATLTLEEFSRVLAELKPGLPVVLEVRRGEKTLRLPAVLGAR